MSTNPLATRKEGDVGFATDFSQYYTALGGAFVPRNLVGVVVDQLQNLGRANIRWSNLFTTLLSIGTSNTLTIEDELGEYVLKVSGVTKLKIEDLAQSIDGAWIKNASTPNSAFGNLNGSQSSAATQTVIGATLTDVAGASRTITTNGRPVKISLNSSASASSVRGSINSGTSAAVVSQIAILRGATIIAVYDPSISRTGENAVACSYPASSFNFIDEPAAGTYTYKLQIADTISTRQCTATNVKLSVYEL